MLLRAALLTVLCTTACTMDFSEYAFGSTIASGGSGAQGGQGAQGGMGGSAGLAVKCDVTPCDVSDGAVCCLPTAGRAPVCDDNGMCDASDTIVTCDEPSDCPGEVCCAVHTGTEFATVQCQSTCADSLNFIVCDDPAECMAPMTCQQSLLPTGYKVCF